MMSDWYHIRGLNRVFVVAAEEGCLEVVQSLIKNPQVDLHVNQEVALRSSAKNGYLDVVRLLIHHGADPKAKECEALRNSAENGHVDVVRFLLELPKSVDKPFIACRALRQSAGRGRLEVVRLLLDSIEFSSGNSNLPLIDSAFNGHVYVFRLLLDHIDHMDLHAEDQSVSNTETHDVGQEGFTNKVDNRRLCNYILTTLLNYNHPSDQHMEIIHLLISDPRTDVSLIIDHALRRSIDFDHPDFVKLVLANPKVNVDVNDYEVLIRSVYSHSSEIFKMLLEFIDMKMGMDDKRHVLKKIMDGHLREISNRAYGEEFVKIIVDFICANPLLLDEIEPPQRGPMDSLHRSQEQSPSDRLCTAEDDCWENDRWADPVLHVSQSGSRDINHQQRGTEGNLEGLLYSAVCACLLRKEYVAVLHIFMALKNVDSMASRMLLIVLHNTETYMNL